MSDSNLGNKLIGIMVPTKSRPERLKVLFDSFLAHEHSRSEFVVGIDKDQLELYGWVKIYPEIRVIETNGEDYVAKANYMASQMKQYKYLYLLADDFRINSEWESKFLEFAVPNCVFYGKDGIANKILCTAVFIDNEMVKKIGYIAPPTLVHYFADNVWRDWGTSMNTYKYFEDVNIQHLHKIANPHYNDAVYVQSEGHFKADEEAYKEYCRNQLILDIQKLYV